MQKNSDQDFKTRDNSDIVYSETMFGNTVTYELSSRHGIVMLEPPIDGGEDELCDMPFRKAKRELLLAWKNKDKFGYGTEEKPIRLYINTFGASGNEALSIYDLILSLRDEGAYINTIANGYAFSAGSIALQAGSIRMSTKSSIIMLHNVKTMSISGDVNEVCKEMEFMAILQNRMDEILSSRAKISKSKLRKIIEKNNNWFLTADEALKSGFIDEIL